MAVDYAEINLLDLFRAAVAAVSGDASVRLALADFTADQVHLVAVGKAAASMTKGAVAHLGEKLIDGLVISKYGHIDETLMADSRLTCIESAHPVPDENSLVAGTALRNYVTHLPAQDTLLFLVSGGTSSLVEVLTPAMTLQDLRRVNQFLLGAGWDINLMNVVRRSLSGIKGGRLASCINCARTLQLLISDVPGDALTSIGSGLLVPPVVSDSELLATVPLPDWLVALQADNDVPPAPDSEVWSRIDSRIVASNRIACDAVIERARELGWNVSSGTGELTGDIKLMASGIASSLCSRDAKPGIYLWGGETTVELPASPGRGGRNQQLALQLAMNMATEADNSLQWQALCCGTDGSDGPTNDAGGLVNERTIADGQLKGLNAQQSLLAADAGSYLAHTGTLVTTGPTGTNVMDLVIAEKKVNRK